MDFNLIYYVDFNTLVMFMCALFLFVAHGNKLPTSILSYTFFLSGFAFTILDKLRDRSSYLEGELFVEYDSIGALLLLPILYSYFFLLMQPDYINRKRVLIVYAPVLLLTVAYFVVTSIFGQLPLIRNYAELQPYIFAPEMIVRYLLRTCVLVQSIWLSLAAFRMYALHKKNLYSNFSYTIGANLKATPWIVCVIMLYGISFFVVAFKPSPWITYVPIVLLAFMPLVMSLMAVRQKPIFISEEKIKIETQQKAAEPSLKVEQLKLLEKKLLKLLNDDEIYKDAELSIDKVCKQLGTNRNYLYTIIKQDFNTTFYDLINGYRLEHAIRLLENPEYNYLKIVDISEQIGFKNTSTFITSFKKKYDITPNEWRNAKN